MDKLLNIFEIIKNLDVGKYGACFVDYKKSAMPVGDIVHEISSNNISVYYEDILEFVKRKPEALNEAVKEGLYSVSSWETYDFYEHAQAAEYLAIEDDIYEHLGDALLLVVLDHIAHELKREWLPGALYDKLVTWASTQDGDDYISDGLDVVEEFFKNKGVV